MQFQVRDISESDYLPNSFVKFIHRMLNGILFISFLFPAASCNPRPG